MPARACALFTLGLGLLSALATLPVAAEDPIRITQLKRCGDLFAGDSLSWCLSAKGLLARRFFSDSMFELRKVVWPTRQEAIRMTWVVIVVVIILSLLLGVGAALAGAGEAAAAGAGDGAAEGAAEGLAEGSALGDAGPSSPGKRIVQSLTQTS